MRSNNPGLKSEQREAVGFLAPLILVILTFVLFAIFFTIAGSLFRDVTYLPERFVGLKNYFALFKDPVFQQSIRFTLLFVLVSVPLEVLIGLIVALVLNESFPFRGLVRASILIPWAIPAAVSGRTFELIYNYSYGAANYLLRVLHLTSSPVNWLGNPLDAFISLILADVWKTSPFAAIILLAGLSAIPDELYWQAKVDRANLFQRFFKITVFLLRPVLIVTFLFRTIQALQVFDFIYVLTRGGPGGSTMSLSMYGYAYFSAGDFGYGSAISVVLFLMAFILSVGYIKLGGFGREVL